jgi:hypothetical protein
VHIAFATFFLALNFYRMISTHPGSLSRRLLAISLAGQCRLLRRNAEHTNDVQLIKEFLKLYSLRFWHGEKFLCAIATARTGLWFVLKMLNVPDLHAAHFPPWRSRATESHPSWLQSIPKISTYLNLSFLTS